METPGIEGEEAVRDGAANLQRGWETVGGRLYLTTHRLVFEAHALNLQTGATVLSLADVESTALAWTKFLGLVPLFPNSLVVRAAGVDHAFVLFDRRGWQRDIEQRRGGRKAP